MGTRKVDLGVYYGEFEFNSSTCKFCGEEIVETSPDNWLHWKTRWVRCREKRATPRTAEDRTPLARAYAEGHLQGMVDRRERKHHDDYTNPYEES